VGPRGAAPGSARALADHPRRLRRHPAEAAGATILVRARDTFWGGRDGYFADPDGHLWEVQWNPHLEITARGEHLMKQRG
jgi:catechol 2,3-dioxygenase-like lactoylglutathione lyase family enzyme